MPATTPPLAEGEATQEHLLRLLWRMEGQVRGVQRMLEEERPSLDVALQLEAINAAADKAAQLLLENHIHVCLMDAVQVQRGEEAVDELMDVLGRVMRN